MALKPDRKITDGTDISFFMNTTGEKGALLVMSAGGSGASMDDSAAVAAYSSASSASGQYVLGVLLCDVVSGDLTRTHLNYQKDEVQVGNKVTICRRGVVTTNMIAGTPVAGQAAFASTTAGKMTSLAFTTANAASISGVQINNPHFTKVGTWLSSMDSDGYAKLDINLV